MSKQHLPEVKLIPLSKLKVDEMNVRKQYVEESVDELAESMKIRGLIAPITVKLHKGKYNVIVGQRRYLAAKKLGWDEIPAIIIDAADDTTKSILSLSENIHRKDVSARDKAQTCKFYLEKFGTIKAVADELGTSEQNIRNWITYIAVPDELKKMVETGKLSSAEAIDITKRVPEKEKAITAAKIISKVNPSRSLRTKIITATRESRPEVKEVLEKTEEMIAPRTIVFSLSKDAALGLHKAAVAGEESPEQKAKEIVVEWLKENDYIAA